MPTTVSMQSIEKSPMLEKSPLRSRRVETYDEVISRLQQYTPTSTGGGHISYRK
jgi:hypothetical protein